MEDLVGSNARRSDSHLYDACLLFLNLTLLKPATQSSTGKLIHKYILLRSIISRKEDQMSDSVYSCEFNFRNTLNIPFLDNR